MAGIVRRSCRRWALALSLLAVFGAFVRSEEPAAGPETAAKPDGLRFTTSAARYADAKFTFAPLTKAKRVGQTIPSWLDRSSRRTEESSLADVPEVGLDAVTNSVEFRKAFRTVAAMHEKEGDDFVDALVLHRPELAGLPFLKGDACKLNDARTSDLSCSGAQLRSALEPYQKRSATYPHNAQLATHVMGTLFGPVDRIPKNVRDDKVPAAVLPAAMQILCIETPELRIGIASSLQLRPPGNEASIAALIRLAIFDPDPGVRAIANEGLKREPFEKYASKLIEGLRHPWPIVAERAAEAIVAQERPEAIPRLIAILDEPDPGAPFEREEAGKKVLMVRDLVKINHHRNCLVCHAPATRFDRRAIGGLVARVPNPDEELPPLVSRLYYEPGANESVRANETYLRQDFSILRKVADHGKWPAMQRFDYIVRTRPATAEEVQTSKRTRQWNDEILSPHRRAVLYALSRLTCTYVGPNASDWRPEIARWIEKTGSDRQ